MDAEVLGQGDSNDRLYTELSRVNNELINTQREMVQRNVRLERAEAALRKAHGELERQVQERTRELEDSLFALRRLSASVLRVQDEERRRVARDLHDTVGQTLTAVKISLFRLENEIKGHSQTANRLAELNELTNQALQEIRTTSYLLHPPLLDEAGFSAAAAWYVEGFNKRSPIQVRLQLPKAIRLPASIEIVLFRVLQESLTNISKHADSATVDVLLQVEQNVIAFSVRDYGKGISAERLVKIHGSGSDVGVGIAGMRERLKEFGGRLVMESDSTGTLLKALVPLPEAV